MVSIAITAANLVFYVTGASSDGGAQTNPNVSFGNYRSSTEFGSGDGNVFDDVTGAEASAGDTEYRCICIKNEHASLSLQSPVVYFSATSGTTDDTNYIAVEVPTGGDTNGTCQTIADESTAPTVNAGNVSDWSTATDKTNGIAINQGSHDVNLDKSEIIFVWWKRMLTAGAGAVTAETVTLAISGDTAA